MDTASEQFTKKAGGELPKDVENAIWGALLTGGLGAVAGGLATKPDENLTPGEQFKQRLKNALLMGAMGAAGGGGAGYLLTRSGIIGNGSNGSDNTDTPTDEEKKLKEWQDRIAKGERYGAAFALGTAGGGLGLVAPNWISKQMKGKIWVPETRKGYVAKRGIPAAAAVVAGLIGHGVVDYAQKDGKPLTPFS